VIHAYLGFNIVTTQEEFVGIASLIKKISGKTSISATDPTGCINKAIQFSGTNDVTISVKELLRVLMGRLNKCRLHSTQICDNFPVVSSHT
jgi:hypothetical protein